MCSLDFGEIACNKYPVLLLLLLLFIVRYKQLNLVPMKKLYNIIFMSGAHGVAGWVWGGDGWVSVDRLLFHVVASAWLWSCRVWQHC